VPVRNGRFGSMVLKRLFRAAPCGGPAALVEAPNRCGGWRSGMHRSRLKKDEIDLRHRWWLYIRWWLDVGHH